MIHINIHFYLYTGNNGKFKEINIKKYKNINVRIL
jgi:hypothetical protein